jgi:hypothetical protein
MMEQTEEESKRQATSNKQRLLYRKSASVSKEPITTMQTDERIAAQKSRWNLARYP